MSIDLIEKSSELPPPEVKEVADRILLLSASRRELGPEQRRFRGREERSDGH